MSQKTSLCHTVNAPGEQKTFGSLKLLPSQAESFTLPVAAAALASWRRIFRRSSAAAASTTDERGQHTGRANMHAGGGGGDSRLPTSDHGHEQGRRVRCRCCAGVGGAGSLDTVISLQGPPAHTRPPRQARRRRTRQRHCKHGTVLRGARGASSAAMETPSPCVPCRRTDAQPYIALYMYVIYIAICRYTLS